MEEENEVHRIRVRCPECGKVFEGFDLPLVHPEAAEDDEDDELAEDQVAACPKCGYEVALDLLEAGTDGIWSETADD